MIGITGGTGVLGRILVGKLMRQNKCHSCFAGDVRNQSEVRSWIESCKPAAVIHLAAVVPVDLVEQEPARAIDVNLGGTLNVLSLLERNSPETWFFYASSSHVYKSGTQPLRETDDREPQTAYGHTKLLGEDAALWYAKYCGLRVCIGRIFSFYHASQKPPFLYPSVLNRLSSHQLDTEFELINGNDVRDMSPAEDIVLSIQGLQKAGAVGVVNIGTGLPTRIVDFVQTIAAPQVKISVVQKREPNWLVADVSKLNAVMKLVGPDEH